MKRKFPQSEIYIETNVLIGGKDFAHNIPLLPLNRTSKSGVYCLRNKLNGRLYIGMARNLEIRYLRHRRDLATGEHCNKLIQLDYDECFKEDSIEFSDWDKLFSFEIIIYCRPSELTFYEHLLIKYVHPYYNIHKERELIYEEPRSTGIKDQEEYEE